MFNLKYAGTYFRYNRKRHITENIFWLDWACQIFKTFLFVVFLISKMFFCCGTAYTCKQNEKAREKENT